MVARRKKLKEQITAGGDGSGREKVSKGRLEGKRKKKGQKAAEAEAERLAEAAAIEERKAAKRMKKEEKKKRKEAERAENRDEERTALDVEGETGTVEEKTKKRKKEENAGNDDGSIVVENGEEKPNKAKRRKNKKVDRWGVPQASSVDPHQAGMEENGDEDVKQREETVEYHPRRIYAGGMPYYTTEDDIHNYFSECGVIEEIDYSTFRDTGKFRGLAFITFKTEAAVKKAVELDGADMGGRYLRIMRCKTKPQGKEKVVYAEPLAKTQGCTSVYVGNMSWDATEKDLRQFFRKCKISGVRFAHDKETGQFKGYGHVDFEDDESVETAIKLDQQLFLNRPIKIAYAVPFKKFPNSSERESSKCFNCGENGHKSFHCPKKGLEV